MVWEMAILFAVVIVAGILMFGTLICFHWKYPLPRRRRTAIQRVVPGGQGEYHSCNAFES